MIWPTLFKSQLGKEQLRTVQMARLGLFAPFGLQSWPCGDSAPPPRPNPGACDVGPDLYQFWIPNSADLQMVTVLLQTARLRFLSIDPTFETLAKPMAKPMAIHCSPVATGLVRLIVSTAGCSLRICLCTAWLVSHARPWHGFGPPAV